MKTWKHFTIVAFLAIFGIVGVFIACDNDNPTDSNPTDNNPTGGTFVVNNGTSIIFTVTITFDNNEVFSGTMTPNETIRRTSGNDVEYKIIFAREYNSYSQQSRIGSLSGGKTIYFNIGE